MHGPYDVSARAAEVLGHLYALGAAHISNDPEAFELVLAEVPAEATTFMPEAAVAIAYTSVQMFRAEDDPLADPDVASLPPAMLDAIGAVLDGDTPDFVSLHDDDPVDVSVRTVGSIWLWAAHGHTEEALRIARRHCANMALYRDAHRDPPAD